MRNLLLFPLDEGGAAEERPKTRKRKNLPKSAKPNRHAVDLPVGERPSVENQLIRASAGTGKTYQLTSRYLRLLLQGVEPETILATTFTRKAAGEILDRIVLWLGQAVTSQTELSKLANAVQMPQLTQEDCQEKLALLTRQIHRLRIYTIDAFFIQMALSFSLELGITPGWQIMEEGSPESNDLRNEAIAGVLRQDSLDDLLVLLHQLTPKGEAKRSLDDMLQGRINDAYRLFLDSAPGAWDMIDVPKPLPQDELAEIVQGLANYPRGDKKQLPDAVEADVQRITNEDWQGFFNGGKTLAKYINKGQTKYGAAKIPADLLALYQQFLPHLRSMVLQSMSAQTRGTYSFLAKYHQQYHALGTGQRLYGFQGITDLLASYSLADDLAHFTFRMDAKIDHLLLDEFQDTSISQWKTLLPIARRCTANKCGRSFFCVGDLKQAIYGWRGGSSEIFDVLDTNLPNLKNSELQESRRSSPIIIDAVNQVFNYLPTWPEKKLGRAKRAACQWEFPQHTTYHTDLSGYFTIETADDTPSSRKDDQEAQVFRRAAERVDTIAKQGKGRSIGILCRTNAKVGQMMNELQRLGVSASEEGGNFLTDSAAVELVLSLLQLTDHSSDSISAYHLATSPWAEKLGLKIGVCEQYPSAESTSSNGNKVQTKSNDLSKPPAGIDLQAINRLVHKVRSYLLDEGFGNAIQAWAVELRPFCNRREARRLTQLVEKAYEYQLKIESPPQLGAERQRRQSTRPTEFVRFIRETKVTDPSNDTIRVMTVHQAKGLEFDVVVLPDLLGPFVEGHDTFLFRRKSIESEIDLVCRYMGKDSRRSFLPDWFTPLLDDFEDRRARDSFCVLYVAMTRAMRALHVFLPSGMQRMSGGKGSAGYLIKDTFASGMALQPTTTIYEAGDRHWFTQGAKSNSESDEVEIPRAPAPRLVKSRAQRRGFETIAPSQIGSSRRVLLSDRFAKHSHESRDFGSLLHLWLSQLIWLTHDQADLTERRFRAVAKPFEDKTDVNLALARLKELLKSEPLNQILNRDQYLADLRSAQPNLSEHIKLEVRIEQPVSGRDKNSIITGTIDRLVLVRSTADKLVAADIIDYKIDFSSNQDASAKSKNTERHQSQMDAYRRVIATSLRLPKQNVSSRLVML